jgi:negative regulator of sigma E activity
VEPVAKREGQTRKFWVDTEKWIKLKTEDIGPDGAVLSTSYYTKIEFVGKFPPRRFHFDPPSGVRVERGQDRPKVMSLDQARRMVGFKALEPAYLPKGFKAVGAAVTPFRKGKILVLRYSDGVTTFSLFQAPGRMLDSRFLEKLQEGPKRSGKGAYSWRRGDLNLTLIGPIPPDEVRKIADSVK